MQTASRPQLTTAKAIAASSVGTIVEWYDYSIYGTAAALVFSKLFFPSVDPVAGLIASYATYAVGYLARPFGGLLFAHFGDRFGRRPVLIATLLIMGVSTAMVGLLPTYSSVGLLAPILLVLLRLIQGLGAGAEYCGAILFAAEYDPAQRGLRGSWPAAATDVSFTLATGIFFLVSSAMPLSAFLAWGWRVLFLLSLAAVAVGYLVRRDLGETQEFTAVKREANAARAPIVEVITQHPGRVAVAMGVAVITPIFYLYTVYLLSFMTRELGMSRTFTLAATTLMTLGSAVACPLWGGLSDRIGRWKIMLFGAVFTAVSAYPLFLLLETRNPVVIVLALMAAVMIGRCAVFAVQPAYYMDLFETRLRFSGMVLAREVTGALIGGMLPLAATTATAAAGGAWWPVATIMVALSLVTIITLLLAPAGLGGRPAAKPLVAAETSSA